MRLVLLGAAIGLGLSLAYAQILQSLLFGVGPADPLTLAGVPAVLAATALVACYLPARRAATIDPTMALRYE
jgi:putative ABC transport system permease protein